MVDKMPSTQRMLRHFDAFLEKHIDADADAEAVSKVARVPSDMQPLIEERLITAIKTQWPAHPHKIYIWRSSGYANVLIIPFGDFDEEHYIAVPIDQYDAFAQNQK